MKPSVEQKHPRFTNRELELVKETFAENEELVKACYKVFFQLPLSELEERAVQNTFVSPDLRNLFDKLFCPGLENEQLFYGVDDWLDVMLDRPVAEAVHYIRARELSVNFIKQQINKLFDNATEVIMFKDLTPNNTKTEDRIFIDLLARKEIIAKVRQMFGTLQVWAGKKEESAEDMMKRLFANSNK